MMRGDRLFTEQRGEMMRQAFGEAASVHENERRTVLLHQAGDALIDFVPHLIGSDGAEFAGRNFDGEVEASALLDFDDYGRGPSAAGEKLSDQFDGLLRGREPNSGERLRGERFEAFQR